MLDTESILSEIENAIELTQEWILIYSSGKAFALQKNELEFNIERGKIFFGFLDDKGFQTWRITNFQQKKNEVLLSLTRNFEKESEQIRLVPRISVSELSASIELARLEKANKLAQIIRENLPDKKIVRVSLNTENGRFAKIILEDSNKRQTAVLSDVSESATPENLIASAILRLSRLEQRRKKPIDEIWIFAEHKLFGNLQKLHALLKENWKLKIKLWKISRRKLNSQKSKNQIIESEIKEYKPLEINDLWREKPKNIQLAENTETSRTAREIIKCAPEKVDLLFTKHGETLRFEGLPFARVRKTLGDEKCWFGVERDRRFLNEKSRADFFELLENLELYRCFNTPNKRHALYALAPEAWLEAIFRRNIKKLDANIILSPIHNQFRADRDKIDLLALRKDGRLIIIEIKVAPDREMVFQAADYWRKIEASRRKGDLSKAKLFGSLQIADAPTLIYLVAPTLSFHRDFSFLSKTVSAEIEIFRFNLNENWRENLKIMTVVEI